jgi:hypothetical protein
MATLKELVFNLFNTPNGGKTPNDFGISLAQGAFWVNYHAAALVKKDIEDKGFIDDSNVQDLGVLTLSKVDQADSNVILWATDVKKVVIPQLLQIANTSVNSIKFFGFIDKVTNIPLCNSEVIGLQQYRQFPKKPDIWSYNIGNTIYVLGKDALDLCFVNVRGVFEFPTMIKNCTFDTATEDCFNWDCPYPIGQHLLSGHYDVRGNYVQGLFERIWNIEMKLSLSNIDEAPNSTTIKTD